MGDGGSKLTPIFLGYLLFRDTQAQQVRGVGDIMGPYGWSMPGCQTKPRPIQALVGGGWLQHRPSGGGTAGLGGEVPHGTSRGEGTDYTSCTDRKKAGD